MGFGVNNFEKRFLKTLQPNIGKGFEKAKKQAIVFQQLPDCDIILK
jgi:hypothetical protein